MDQIQLDTIEEAIAEIKNGKVIIVVDDESRENEGDFVCAAECVTPEIVNFMAKYGRGLICVPLVEDRCEELGLEMMVGTNTALYETPFTISVDLIGHGCTTGISAHDRFKTIRALVDPATNPDELGKPGHIFPLKAKRGGVLRRAGHTEASIDFARLAGFKPAGVLVEIMNDDGTMARMPDLEAFATEHKIKLVTIEDIIEYRRKRERHVREVAEANLPTEFGNFKIKGFLNDYDDKEHIALIMGELDTTKPVLLRVHSECLTGDVFHSLRCDCGAQLAAAMKAIAART